MLVTISDKKIAVASTTNPNLIAYYTADVVTANDYYPFGSQMPGRKFSQPNSSYRYGFNGKEKDNEVKGEGNQQDYGMRIYDPRLGRFLSVDPITKKYPELTPYQFASNRCIQGIDIDGLEVFLVTGNAGIFMLVGGMEYNVGIAFSKDGIALVAGVTTQAGIGLEAGASVTGTFFPTMKDINDVDGAEGEFAGISAAGAYLGKFEVGAAVSNGEWGATFGVGVGIGAHVSADFNGPSAIKVIKWDEIASFISGNTEESKKVQAILNIGDKKNQNSIQIVKNYITKLATDFKDKRITDLNSKNSDNKKIIKAANATIDKYKNSNAFMKLFRYEDKVKAEIIKGAAEKNTKVNDAEIKTLKETEIKF